MKKYRQVILMGMLILSILIFIAWFYNPKEEDDVSVILPNVRVMEVLTSLNQEQSIFDGSIQPKETYQGSFTKVKSINNVYVEHGQSIKRGTVLMSVNDEDEQENLAIAQQAYTVALNNQQQAESLMMDEAMNLEKEKINRQNQIAQLRREVQALETQLQRAIVAKADTTQLTFQLESAKGALSYQENVEPESLTIAHYQYEAALSNYEASSMKVFIALGSVHMAQQHVMQTQLFSQIDGVVVMIQKVGDITSPQTPSVVVESHEKVAVFGLSQNNIHRVHEKSIAQIITEGEEFEGMISNVSFIPDKTRIYEVQVDIGVKEDLNIGENVEVLVDLAETEGTWIDLNLLKNDGQDYVYVVHSNRINKRRVERLGLKNNLVLVKNIEKGDRIVVEGYRNLKVGDEVHVVGESNE